MSQSISAAFFDVDGTLIDSQTHTIPTSTITALHALRKRGIKTAIASGRDMKNLQMMQDLDFSCFDGFVLNNGMCVYDASCTLLYQHTLPKDMVQNLLTYAKTVDMTLILESKDDIYTATDVNPYVAIANAYYHETTPHPGIWQGEDILKISCFQAKDHIFAPFIKESHLHILPTPTTTFDITLATVSKLTGIHELMQYWQLPMNDFLCFGDHENDMEMLQGANLGIAVKDPLGSFTLQEIADDVCARASEDGIYHYLKTHHFI